MANFDIGKLKQTISLRIVLAAIVLGLVFIGLVYVRTEQRKRIDTKRSELAKITSHKTTQVKMWMKERTADANHFSISPLYADALFNWLKNRDTLVGLQLEHRNQLIKELRGFKDVMMVVDEQPIVFSTDKPHDPLDSKLKKMVRESISGKRIQFTSFSSGNLSAESYIAISAPIYKNNDLPFAALLFLIDPKDYLFPLLGTSSMGDVVGFQETWLLERADGVVFGSDGNNGSISQLAQNKGEKGRGGDSPMTPTVLVFRTTVNDPLPLSEVLTVEMFSHNTKPLRLGNTEMVFTAAPIEGTPWMLVSMQEMQSVVNPVYLTALVMGIMVVGVLLLLGLGLSLVEKRRNQSRLEDLLDKEREASLRAKAAEDRIRDVVDNSFDAVLFFDGEGTIVYASDKVKSYLGLVMASGSECLVWDLFAPGDAARFQNMLAHDGEALEKGSHSVCLRIAQGQWHWVEASFHALVHSSLQGQWVLNIMDVHERKTVQEKLENLRLFLSCIVENAGYAIVATNTQGIITLFNQAAEKMFGYSSDEMVGKQTPFVIHVPAELDEYAKTLSNKLGRDVSCEFDVFVAELQNSLSDEREWTFVRKDGSTLPGALKVTMLKDAFGQISGYVGVIADLTHYKAQEARMKEQDLLLGHYHKVAKLGAYRLDVKTGNWVCTDVLDDIFGIGSDEVKDIGAWSDILYEDDKEMMQGYFNREVLVKHRPFDKKYRIRRKNDSQVRWVHGRGELEFNAQGELCFMIGTIRDITEQVAIEQSVKLTEQRYKQLFENMSGAVALHECVFNADGVLVDFRFLDINHTFEEMFDLKKDELLGKTIFEKVGEKAGFWFDKFKNIVVNGVADRFVEHLEQTGIFAEAVMFRPVPNQVAMILYDVTERVLSQQKLYESEQKFSIFYNLNPDAAGISRFADGKLLDVNPAFTQFLEYTPEECLGKSTLELGLWYDPNDRMVMAGKLKENGMVDNYEFKARTKSGKVVETLFSSKRINYKGEECMLFIVRDITERKKHENQIKLLNEQLERKVEERTLQLAQANRDLEAFSYSVSHDLRAPLRHVDGFMKLMYAQIPNPPDSVQSYYQKISSASHRMSSMIDELLQFSRLGRKEINRSNVDMKLLVEEVIDQMMPDLASRNIKWVIGELPVVEGDKNLLRIAFENLIGNAVKYSSKQALAVIELGTVNTSEGRAEIFVKDNGVGFNMAYVDKLFGVFQRLHSAEEFDGTGIGLANVKQIIQRHGGTIKVEAEVNQGATFFVTLNAII